MTLEWWMKYGDHILDLALYIGIAAALILLCKWVWEARQARRDRKAAAEWLQMREEEQAGK